MATTTPDNLRSPNPTDPFNLIADWANSMADVQAALVKRANFYLGTPAQRNAFTTAPEGTHWQDTTGSNLWEWVRRGSTWRPVHQIASGEETGITTTVGAYTNRAVTFPAGLFTSAPQVVISPGGSAPSRYDRVVWQPTAVTTSGFNIRCYSFGTVGYSDVNFVWTAVQTS